MCEKPSASELEYIMYVNGTDEERRNRQEISRKILKESIVEEIKRNYAGYNEIWLVYFFHTTRIDTDHSFFSSFIHNKIVDIEDYDPSTE
jgi:hypothetical protein